MIKKFIAYIGTIITCLTLCAGVAHATNPATLPSDSVHNGFYVNGGQDINAAGTVNGDAWLAGNSVHITGTVNGNVYAAGSEIVVDGNVNGNAHLAGSKVTIHGNVNGSLYAAGSQITIDNNAHVTGGVVLAGSLEDVNGSIGGQAYFYGSEVNLNGPIGGNTTIHAAQITLSDKATVSGDLRYDQNAKISIANDKQISGSITKIAPQTNKNNPVLERLQALIFGLLASLLLGIVIMNILPGSAVAVSEVAINKPAQSILAGLGFIIFVPIIAILLLIIAVGLPLAAVVGMVYITTLIISQVFVGIAIGRKILKDPPLNFVQNLNTLLIGLGILSIISLVPILGGIAGFIVVCGGTGALTLRAYARVQQVRAKQLHS